MQTKLCLSSSLPMHRFNAIGQIGKMPGKITIDMDVDIDEDGNMTAV